MKHSSAGSTHSKAVPTKRRPPAPKPAARKTPKSSPSKTPVKGAPRSRKPPLVSVKRPVLETRESKQSQLISRLGAASGASMAQLTSLTGWQPHTVRGAISGSLRKRLGLNVTCETEEGVRVYRIVEDAAP
jgi:hypothetical protein